MTAVKRGIIQFAPGVEKVRISAPGVDVDAAGPAQFLLHEAALYSQPYYSAFVACPFAGNTSTSNLNQFTDVTIPDVDSDPIVMHWVVDADGNICFPMPKSTGTGSDASGYAVDTYFVRTWVMNSTTVRVRFVKPSSSRRSPLGVYMIVIRKPDLT